MFKRMPFAVFVLWCVCTLFVPGCAGESCRNESVGGPTRAAWRLSSPAALTIAPGATQTYEIRSEWVHSDAHGINLTVTADRAGWVVSIAPSRIVIASTDEPTATVTVQAPAGEPVGTSCIITVRGEEVGESVQSVSTTATVSAAVATGLTKVSDFDLNAHGVQVAEFQVTNGVPGELIGSMLSTFVPGTMYWYRPDNVLNLGVNVTKTYHVAAIALDSTNPGPFTIEAKFGKAGTEYAASSTFNPRVLTEVAYRIQPIGMNLNNHLIGAEATFQVTITIPPGKAGNYAVTFQSVSPGITMTSDPTTAAIGAAGGSVTYTIVARRTAPDHTNGYKTHEIVVVGTHDANPECNLTQVVPIYGSD